MYRQGWNERNGGNISMLLNDDAILPYIKKNKIIRDLQFKGEFPAFAGRYFSFVTSPVYPKRP